MGGQPTKFIKGTQLLSGVISTYLGLLPNSHSAVLQSATLKIRVASEEVSSKKMPKHGRISELTM